MSGFKIMETMNKMDLAGSFLKPIPGTYAADQLMPIPPDADYCPYPKSYTCDENYEYRSVWQIMYY